MEPVHPKLIKIVEERDELRKQLRAERIRSGHLRLQLAKAKRTLDTAAMIKRRDQHVGC